MAKKKNQKVREVMTAEPMTIEASTPLATAARVMRDGDIGSVIVMADGSVQGILTDRDIVIRAVAEGRDPAETNAAEICSGELVCVQAEDSVSEAIRLMREKTVRRLPVVDGRRPVGIVSLGDLAVERDRDSVLGEISAANPNR